MKRRDFMTRIMGAAAASWVTTARDAMAVDAFAASGLNGQHRSPRRRRQPAENRKLKQVCISTWSFHNYFQSTRDKEFNQSGEMLALLDFPEMIADRYRVHNLEFVAPHFASLETAYLQELNGRIQRAGSRLLNIPVDIAEIWREGGLSDPNPEVRENAITASKQWIDIAKQLGARSVRCDPGRMNVDDLTLTIDSYKKLAAYGRSKRIDVLIENHGPIGSEHPEALVKLFQRVGGDFIGALPDFGNFPDDATRLRGLPMLFPYARTVCHAKGLEFDPSGNETRFNFEKCVEISKRAHYKGVYSIEYEGPANPYEGVQKVVDELLKFL